MMKKFLIYLYSCLLISTVLFFISYENIWAEDLKNSEETFLPYKAVIHVHSTFSSGKDTIDELALLAQKKGIDVLVMNDHDLIRMEYGIRPFRNLFKLPVSKASVLKIGAEKYLNEINRVNKKFNDVTVIGGLESAPFYYWNGSLLNGNLVSYNWRKHIHILGLNTPESISGLPILHNKFSTQYTYTFLKRFFFFLLSSFLSIFLLKWKGYFRISGIIILVTGLLGVINYHPFPSSPYNQYHGDQQERPYQELIDYVNKKGGLTFWAHPESNKTKEQYFGIEMRTPKYKESLLNTDNYNGFEAAYEDSITFTEPGNGWDQVLLEYTKGIRKNPIWGIGGIDYHGKDSKSFDNIMTIFLSKKKPTVSIILDLLKNGKMYSLRKKGDYHLRMDSFTLSSSSNKKAISGDNLKISDNKVEIEFRVSCSDNKNRKIYIILVRSGVVFKNFSGETPLKIQIKDFTKEDENKIFYRILVKGEGPNYIISNPIFLTS